MANLIESFLKWVQSIFSRTPEPPDDSQLKFRLIQSGRPGQILYGGVLPLTSGKVHYLECLPLTLAEQRMAKLCADQSAPGTPIRTHKVCFFYYRIDDPKDRHTVFYDQFSFVASRASSDWMAVRVTNDLFHEIKRVSELKHVDMGLSLQVSPQRLFIKTPEASIYWGAALSTFFRLRDQQRNRL
jgi:hypothetical protein